MIYEKHILFFNKVIKMLLNETMFADFTKTLQNRFLTEPDIFDLVQDRELFDTEMYLRFVESNLKREEKRKETEKELKEHNFGEL